MATAEQTKRSEWLEKRRRSVGSSECAAILGEGYEGQTRMSIYENKVYGTEPKFSEEQEKRLQVGKELEPGVLRLFTIETGIELDVADYFIVHDEFDWLSCTLDAGFYENNGHGRQLIPVEAKIVNYFAGFDWKNGRLPLKFDVQVHHQMLVCDASYAYLFGIVDGMPQVRKVERDEDLIDVIKIQCRAFWDLVETQTPPEPDGKNGTAQSLGRMYGKTSGATIELPPEAVEWDARFQAAKQKIKDATEDEALYGNKIRAAIGEAEYGQLPDGAMYRWQRQIVNYKAKEACSIPKTVLTRKG